MRQMVSLEQDYEAIKAAKEEVDIQLSDCLEAKDAAKHGKRVVEVSAKCHCKLAASLLVRIDIQKERI